MFKTPRKPGVTPPENGGALYIRKEHIRKEHNNKNKEQEHILENKINLKSWEREDRALPLPSELPGRMDHPGSDLKAPEGDDNPGKPDDSGFDLIGAIANLLADYKGDDSPGSDFQVLEGDDSPGSDLKAPETLLVA